MSARITYATDYQARSARDARDREYGDRSYWDYLERAALECCARYVLRGDMERAAHMLTRTLGESLQGNDGE